MALQIQQDISGRLVTEKAFSVIDGIMRDRDLGKFTVSNVVPAPNDLGLMAQPQQLLSTWPTTVKWNNAGRTAIGVTGNDFVLSNPMGWESVQVRGSGDYFLTTVGTTSPGTIATATLKENVGIFFEAYIYGITGSPVRDYLQVQFGLNQFRLHIHSDGTADLEDLRPTATQQYLLTGASLTSSGGGGSALIGRLLQIIIIPWRRGRLLFATNLGGLFEVSVGERLDYTTTTYKRTPGDAAYHIITEASQVVITPIPGMKHLLTVNQVTYATSGMITSPVIDLPYETPTAPQTQYLYADQQDGTAVTLTVLDANGNLFVPTTNNPLGELKYQIAFTSPDPTRSAFAYEVNIAFDRQLGDRKYNTNLIGSPNSCHYQFARDRSQKEFTYELDNPNEKWTSLKDFWNCKISAQFVADTVDATTETIFTGYTNAPEFVDGVASRIRIPCSGLRKHLKSFLLSEDQKFDGMTHVATVLQLLHIAGYDPPNVITADDDGVTLETAPPGEDPYWRPANGTSVDDYIQHICDTFSGWVFDDIAGIFYYAPKEWFTAAALAGSLTVPEIYAVTPLDPTSGMPIASAQGPNPTTLTALANSVTQNSEEVKANDIWVLGIDPATGETIAAHYEDFDSINTKTALNYVGERRTFIYASASITTVFMAQQACAVFAQRLTQPIRTVTLNLADFQWSTLPLEGVVYIQNYGYALVTAVDGNLSIDRNRITSYTCELI